MQYYIDMIPHGRPLLNQLAALVGPVINMLIEFHLSEINGSCRARTWTACLKDGDAITIVLTYSFLTTNYLCSINIDKHAAVPLQ